MGNMRLHLLAERLTSLMQSNLRQAAAAHGLKLVQLEALIYLSLANRYSDTPMALTEYVGVTKGTISQTLKALERHELIVKSPDPDDGRIQRCSLTAKARAIVASAYPAGCFADLKGKTATSLADSLEEQLRALQRVNESKTFGQCNTCRFFESRKRGGRCGLTSELLTKSDVLKICREHENPAA